MGSLHHELVIFLQSRNCFRYVTKNDIKGDIFGWTTSYGRISPQSGFSTKQAVGVADIVIDLDFRGEIKVHLLKYTQRKFDIKRERK